ncbi:MAG: V-type ATPase subunit [Planctomycetes bacterium]|nr:V-type ATPase subunit [Planctomycetota bacterium]
MIGLACGTYAFLHARLGAIKAELLTDRHWEQLVAAGSFAEQRPVLESTAYAKHLAGTPEAALRNIQGALHRPARKIERSVPALTGRFIRVWERRDLLRNLKTILKGKALGRSAEDIRSELLDLDPAHLLPVEALLRCSSLEAALDLLEATELRHWIKEARRIYERDPTLFGLDAALDRLYYPELCRQLEQLDRSDRAAIEPLVNSEIDQVNLLWLLRYRLNYRLSPAETYYLLVPVTGRIGVERLKAAVREESLEAIAARIAQEPYRRLVARCQTIWQVEVALRRFRADQARASLRRAVFTLGEALALLVLKGIEIRDLVAVLEGTRLGATRHDILEQLASPAMGRE